MSSMKELAIELATETIDVRRDANGNPLIVPYTGAEAVPYLRPSQMDNMLDDKSFFDLNWTPSRMVDGIIADPSLLDEWKTSPSPKLLARMKRAGGGFDKADRGTEFHHWIARTLRGQIDVADVPDEFRPAVEAALVALDEIGATVVAVERFIVNDTIRYAGTFDALVDIDGRHEILDWKTGRLHHLGLLVQSYAYACAPYYFTQGDAADGSGDIRELKPKTRTDRALVGEVDIDAGTVKIRPVDLTCGPDVFRLVDELRTIRTVTAYGKPLNGARAAKDKIDEHFGDTVEVSTVDDTWRAGMRTRIAAIIDAGHASRLGAAWPEGVPTLKTGDPITLAQGEEVAAVVALVEKQCQMPFPPDSTTVAPRRPRKDWTATVRPDEGAEVSDAAVGLLNARAELLDADGRAWVAAVLEDATRLCAPLRLTRPHGAKTERRLAICTAIVACAGFGDDDIVRTLIAVATGCDVQPTVPFATAFAALTIDEAERLTRIVQAIDDRELVLTFDDAGIGLDGDLAAIAA